VKQHSSPADCITTIIFSVILIQMSAGLAVLKNQVPKGLPDYVNIAYNHEAILIPYFSNLGVL
jgi:hypothetical protein